MDITPSGQSLGACITGIDLAQPLSDTDRRAILHTATRDFAKFWDMMVAKPGSTRQPLTQQQRATKPPVSQPIFLRHPITGRYVLESGQMLDFLFRHQERADYLYAHHWAVGDVLMWDNIGTVHNAIGDYTADEPRYMRRVQVMATLDYPRLVA